MSTSNFNLRGIPNEVMDLLKSQAVRQKRSVNQLVLSLIEQGIGFSKITPRPIYHDLDFLIGTCSNAEAEEFEKNTKDFDAVDKDIW